MHTNFGGNILTETIKQYVSRLGVPYFFIISGFFLSKKIISGENEKAILCDYLKRILLLFCLWSLIYSPYHLMVLFQQNHNVFQTLLLYIQNLLFLAPSYMWYLMAVSVAAVPFCLFYKYKFNMLFILSIILYVLGTIGNSYKGIIGDYNGRFDWYYHIFLTTRNGVFFAPLFLCIGGLSSKFEFRAFKFNKLLFMLGVSYIAFCIEVFIVRSRVPFYQDCSMYFVLPILEYFITRLTIMEWKCNKLRFASEFFRKTSTGIYCSQFGFILIYTRLIKSIGQFNTEGFVVYFLTVFSGIIMSLAIMQSKSKLLKKLI